MNKTMRALCGVVFVLSITGGQEARAALQAYEGFDYGPAGSDLLGKNGSSGFSSAWTGGGFNVNLSTNYHVTSAGLTYHDLRVGGGAGETVTTPSSKLVAASAVKNDLDVLPAARVPESSSAVLFVLGSVLVAAERLARRYRVVR